MQFAVAHDEDAVAMPRDVWINVQVKEGEPIQAVEWSRDAT